MATEVIHEHSNTDSSGGAGFLVGAIILAVVVLFLLYFGVNMFRGLGAGGATGGTNVQIPDKVNVNVQGQGSK